MRAYDRHAEVLGGQVAAAVTYFGFLSFFPLLALGFAVVGYLSAVYPEAREGVTAAVEDAFPSLVGTGRGQLDLTAMTGARSSAGLLGLVGLLYAGLGWVDALRDGLRRVFGTSADPPSLVRKKLLDVVVLVLLGSALLASVLASSLATAATTDALGVVGLAATPAATVLLKVLAVALAVVADTALFAILLSRLPGAALPWRQLRSGALLGAVGFEVLKLLGTFLVARTMANPVYATVAVVVGLLVWINLASRLLVYSAAWTATHPYSLQPAAPGAGRSTGLAVGTEPVSVVAPPDYGPVPVGAPAAGASPGRRTSTVRGTLLGAAAGAALAGVVSRRRSRV